MRSLACLPDRNPIWLPGGPKRHRPAPPVVPIVKPLDASFAWDLRSDQLAVRIFLIRVQTHLQPECEGRCESHA